MTTENKTPPASTETPKPVVKVKAGTTQEVREYLAKCKAAGVKSQTVTDDFGNVLDDVYGHGATLK